ncbi:hypothetical protein [Streptomyces sp. YU58]|uniref:hypothetical protein n=1 Tax=Streptomyces sp. SX92 TaxID=3158972 RepID=UPI0027BA0A06|nr:hypothetical protein [Streptomyces coralus]WLW50304.1 hypothetical protein QU709_02550 [Streptomyces coralus]
MTVETPDGQFVIGSPGGDPGLIVAGGCNAHGGKHALGIGEALADLVADAGQGCRSNSPSRPRLKSPIGKVVTGA